MLICNQRRLNFEFWRSSFARMLVGVASKIKRLSSSQVWEHAGVALPKDVARCRQRKESSSGNFSLNPAQHSFELHVVRD